MKKNLVLTGMMGVGKSTIGKKLAKKLKLDFVDTDEIIESKEKSSIKNIFNKRGESYFRKLEKKVALQELKKSNLVVALGGGAFIDKVVRNEIKNSCLSFWLDLSIPSLLKRVKKTKKRPLLDLERLEESMIEIYSERKKIYNESNFRIKCDLLNKEEIVDKIIKLL